MRSEGGGRLVRSVHSSNKLVNSGNYYGINHNIIKISTGVIMVMMMMMIFSYYSNLSVDLLIRILTQH